MTYEFRYKDIVKADSVNDTKLQLLFDSITVPGEFDGDDLEKIQDFKIKVEAHAIQATGCDVGRWLATGDRVAIN